MKLIYYFVYINPSSSNLYILTNKKNRLYLFFINYFLLCFIYAPSYNNNYYYYQFRYYYYNKTNVLFILCKFNNYKEITYSINLNLLKNYNKLYKYNIKNKIYDLHDYNIYYIKKFNMMYLYKLYNYIY